MAVIASEGMESVVLFDETRDLLCKAVCDWSGVPLSMENVEKRAEVFWHERFQHRDENKFDFIPQGGGDFVTNHCCAGEWITIVAMNVALEQMVNHMECEVPEQDFSYDLSRLPSIPKSRFIIQHVRAVV